MSRNVKKRNLEAWLAPSQHGSWRSSPHESVFIFFVSHVGLSLKVVSGRNMKQVGRICVVSFLNLLFFLKKNINEEGLWMRSRGLRRLWCSAKICLSLFRSYDSYEVGGLLGERNKFYVRCWASYEFLQIPRSALHYRPAEMLRLRKIPRSPVPNPKAGSSFKLQTAFEHLKKHSQRKMKKSMLSLLKLSCRGLAIPYVALDELLATCDFISLHAPLLPSTKHMINFEKLKIMKKGIMRPGEITWPSNYLLAHCLDLQNSCLKVKEYMDFNLVTELCKAKSKKNFLSTALLSFWLTNQLFLLILRFFHERPQ